MSDWLYHLASTWFETETETMPIYTAPLIATTRAPPPVPWTGNVGLGAICISGGAAVATFVSMKALKAWKDRQLRDAQLFEAQFRAQTQADRAQGFVSDFTRGSKYIKRLPSLLTHIRNAAIAHPRKWRAGRLTLENAHERWTIDIVQRVKAMEDDRQREVDAFLTDFQMRFGPDIHVPNLPDELQREQTEPTMPNDMRQAIEEQRLTSAQPSQAQAPVLDVVPSPTLRDDASTACERKVQGVVSVQLSVPSPPTFHRTPSPPVDLARERKRSTDVENEAATNISRSGSDDATAVRCIPDSGEDNDEYELPSNPSVKRKATEQGERASKKYVAGDDLDPIHSDASHILCAAGDDSEPIHSDLSHISCAEYDPWVCRLKAMKQFTDTNYRYRTWFSLVEKAGPKLCILSTVVKNCLLPLLPVLQRVKHQSSTDQRFNFLGTVQSFCLDPDHQDWSSSKLAFSYIAYFVMMHDSHGIVVAANALRVHVENAHDLAHDCHQGFCDNPFHRFSQPKHLNRGNRCKKIALAHFTATGKLESEVCDNPLCHTYNHPCRVRNAILPLMTIAIDTFFVLNNITNMYDKTEAPDWMFGSALLDHDILAPTIRKDEVCVWEFRKGGGVMKQPIPIIPQLLELFSRHPIALAMPLYEIDKQAFYFFSHFTKRKAFLQKKYSFQDELHSLHRVNQYALPQKNDDEYLDQSSRISGFSCKVCLSRSNVDQPWVQPGTRYSTISYVAHSLTHANFTPIWTQKNILQALSEEMSISDVLGNELALHISMCILDDHTLSSIFETTQKAFSHGEFPYDLCAKDFAVTR